MATPGRTYGRPNSAVGVKWYFKPSMGRLIGRIPGVVRKSAKVLAVNAILEEKRGKDHPASKCHGKDWKNFVSCLRKEMKDIMKKDVIESKASEIAGKYNIPTSTKRTPAWAQK
ncbi:MAG: hypothetical protein QXV75_07160 [Candidatus Bathyarchaeia archaeon]